MSALENYYAQQRGERLNAREQRAANIAEAEERGISLPQVELEHLRARQAAEFGPEQREQDAEFDQRQADSARINDLLRDPAVVKQLREATAPRPVEPPEDVTAQQKVSRWQPAPGTMLARALEAERRPAASPWSTDRTTWGATQS